MDILIYIIGGILAGIATGLVGLSAATIIAPLFATVLGMDPYVAIGIALASDVLASASSATNYIRHKNINIKNASIMAVAVVLFTILGSYLSASTDPYNLNSMLNIFVVMLGLRFIVYPVKNRSNPLMKKGKRILLQSFVWGIIIGLISGFFGAGGGLSMLAVLTMLLGYNLKEGIGTSVFIMTFTALVGAVTHFIIGGTILNALLITSAAAFIGANLASIYANRVNDVVLNRVIGAFLISFGVVLLIIFFYKKTNHVRFLYV